MKEWILIVVHIKTILGVSMFFSAPSFPADNIRVVLGLYMDNGKGNGNYYSILGLYKYSRHFEKISSEAQTSSCCRCLLALLRVNLGLSVSCEL